MAMTGKADGAPPVRAEVAVVGCGPTGATLANLPGHAGLRVAVLDRERALSDQPRAVHFDGEVMRIFQALGLAEALPDTYLHERDPHVRAFIEQAMALGEIIQTTDPSVAAARDARFARDGAGEIVNLAPRLGPGLHAGPAGGLIPAQPRLADGRLMDDAIGGPRWALLGRAPPPLSAALVALGAVTVDDPAIVPLLAEAGTGGLVLRPDRAVLGPVEDPQTARLLGGLAALPAIERIGGAR